MDNKAETGQWVSESYPVTTDQEIRLTCLSQACQVNPGLKATEILEATQKFYDFVTATSKTNQ